MLAANLSLERLDQIVQQRTGLGETGRTYLVGADGRLISSTTAARGWRHRLRRHRAAVVARQDGEGLYVDDRSMPVIGVYSWIADRGSGLLAEMSQDEAFGSARQLALTIGLVGLSVGRPAHGWRVVVARRVTRPILRWPRPPPRSPRATSRRYPGSGPRTRSARSRWRSTR